MPRFKKILASLALFAGLTNLAIAQTTLYVDAANGSNDNTGQSADDAYANIEYASHRTAPGDTVIILPGIYSGGNSSPWNEVFIGNSGEAGAYITYRGISDENGNRPVISSSSYSAISVYQRSYIVIDNIEFVASSEDLKGLRTDPNFGETFWERRAGIRVDQSHHIIVRNCYAHDFPGNGFAMGGSDVVLFEDNLAEHNAFVSNNGNSGFSSYHANDFDVDGFEEYPDHRIIYKGNVSRYNTNLRGFAGAIGGDSLTDGNGIIIDDFRQEQSDTPTPYNGRTLLLENECYGNGGRGINLFSSDNIDVFNNTLFDNALSTRIQFPAYTIAISDDQLSIGKVDDAIIANNVLVNSNESPNTVGSYLDTNITFMNNLHWNVGGDAIAIGESDIVADPQFQLARGLSQSEIELLATMLNPYDGDAPQAALRTPTQNNGFPIQNLKLATGSAAIDAGINLALSTPIGEAIDLGAFEFDPNNALPEQTPYKNDGLPRALVHLSEVFGYEYDEGGQNVGIHKNRATRKHRWSNSRTLSPRILRFLDFLNRIARKINTARLTAGEWSEYSVTIESDRYDLVLNANTRTEDTRVRFILDYQVIAELDIPVGQNPWLLQEIIKRDLILPEGEAIIRVEVVSGKVNLHSFALSKIDGVRNSLYLPAALPSEGRAGTEYTGRLGFSAVQAAGIQLKLYDFSEGFEGVAEANVNVNIGEFGELDLNFLIPEDAEPHNNYVVLAQMFDAGGGLLEEAEPTFITVNPLVVNYLDAPFGLPTTIAAGATYTTEVDYAAAEAGHILLKLYEADPDTGSWIEVPGNPATAFGVAPGEIGSATMSLEIPADIDTSKDYVMTLVYYNEGWNTWLFFYPQQDVEFADSLAWSSYPSTIPSNGNINISVDYTAGYGSRDIVLELFTENFGWLAQSPVATVLAGSGGSLNLNIPYGGPLAIGDSMRLKVSLRPQGTSWESNISEEYAEVTVVESSSIDPTISFAPVPASVPTTGSFEVQVSYQTGDAPRDLVLEVFDASSDSWVWLGQSQITVPADSSGSATIAYTIGTPLPLGDGVVGLKVGIRPEGGDWSTSFEDVYHSTSSVD